MRFLFLLFLFGVAHAADPAAQRAQFKRALVVAERAPLHEFAAAARPLAGHPLAPYLEFVHLHRQLDTVAPARIERFLTQYPALPIADDLRNAWLHALIKRRDWVRFRAFYVERKDKDLRCAHLHVRLVAGTDAKFLDDALAMWLSGATLPASCDTSFAALKLAGRLTPERLWQRFDLAAEAGNLALMRHLANALGGSARTRAQAYTAFLSAPTQPATQRWPRDARSRRIAALGLARLAQRDPDGAEALFAALATPLKLDNAERGRVLHAIALWSAASYLPTAAARFARVPTAAFDARLHEWQAREALARGDRAAARKAIAAMPAAQRQEPRWRYLDARLRELAGERGAAAGEFAALAIEPSYYGFLAADRLDRPYALCPLAPVGDAAARQQVARAPGLVRAFELHAIERDAWARREWDATLQSMDETQRRLAVALADDAGWYDRAVFTLNRGEDLRLYELRFPLPHARHLRAQAKLNGLDPAWVAALIRAESAWLADARSHANALGLMQLLPGTARAEARRLGMPWGGEASLYQPLTNLTLGSAHLSQLLARQGGLMYLATAAYNAGPTPVARWLAQRPPRETDLWIETIPYFETRDYVSRILAFSVIYDWRLSGKAVPVSRRMHGDLRGARREFVCPVPAPGPAPIASRTEPAPLTQP